MRIACIALLLVAGSFPACHSTGQRIGGDAWSQPDLPIEPAGDVVDATVDGIPVDGVTDATVDPTPDAPPCTEAPPCPDGPADGVMGRACYGDGACDEVPGGRCRSEMVEFFDGEEYRTNPNGSCTLYTGGEYACDPETDEGCPPGSHCLDPGIESGIEWHMCMDACTPVDTSGDLHDWACGCRMGYQCHMSYGICLSGCSNDRECCETWTDLNGNYRRDTGEVVRYPECSNYCDGDDPGEVTDCRASHACVNLGREGARFGDPCEHDSHCPVDGQCWSWRDPDTGEEYYPGGYCSRMGCHFPGRGCEDAGGACINTGTVEDPMGICIRPCHTGSDASDPSFECRRTPGEEHACFPISSWAWVGGAPPGGEDGYCFPGNYGPGTGGIGDACEDASDCASPLGIGECADWWIPPFCTVRCNETLAEDRAICGPAGTGGVAEGICGWNMCWPGCGSPGAPLGSNGCDRSDQACAPLSTFDSVTWVAAGASRPTGFCMPMCTSDEQCEGVFGPGSSCDTTSGVCS